jgi:anti-sigma factor RsiW
MKKSEQQLISRGLDGALDESERTAFERLLAENPEAARLAERWERTGDHLRTTMAPPAIPDAAVAWQDIRREIRRQTADTKPAGATETANWAGRMRWAGAFAAVCFLLLAGWLGYRYTVDGEAMFARGTTSMSPLPPAPERVEWVVAEVPGATTMIFTDAETEMTVIWMDLADAGNSHDS